MSALGAGSQDASQDSRSIHLAWLFIAVLAAAPAVWVLAAITSLSFVPHWPAADVLLLGVLAAPLLEEIVFRGGLQEWLIRRYGRRERRSHWPSAANISVSLLFAACHLWSHPPLWAAAMFVPSLVFGALYEQRRHLGAPVVMHALYNAAYLVLLG